MNRFGHDYIQSGPKDELCSDSISYKALGLSFGSNKDSVEESSYIQFDPCITYRSVNGGMDFAEVMSRLGESVVMKVTRYMPGYTDYTIKYQDLGLVLSFESKFPDGTDSSMQLAKAEDGYEATD